jgi:hypothetical protein
MTGIPRWVEEFLTIPFVNKGKSADGCDCFGLVRFVLMVKLGIVTTDYSFITCTDYVSINDAIRAAERDSETWRSFDLGKAQTFDVVPMTEVYRGDVVEAHVGIMVTNRYLLHTEKMSGPACLDIGNASIAHRFHPQNAPLVWRHRKLWH